MESMALTEHKVQQDQQEPMGPMVRMGLPEGQSDLRDHRDQPGQTEQTEQTEQTGQTEQLELMGQQDHRGQ